MSRKITDIQPQKKREGYYSIFLDGEYTFSLSELDLSIAGLHIEEEINEDRLLELQKLSQQSKIYSRALYYLRFGPRTVWQMREYLVRKVGFDEEEVVAVLQKLENDKFLNDETYIESYVSSRQIFRPRSKRQLSNELRKKGINAKLIDESLRMLDDDSQRAAAEQIIRKKLLLPRFQDKQKLTEYMLRQGFPYSLVKEVITEVSLETS